MNAFTLENPCILDPIHQEAHLLSLHWADILQKKGQTFDRSGLEKLESDMEYFLRLYHCEPRISSSEDRTPTDNMHWGLLTGA